MPLPKQKIERELLHVRNIDCKGYKRIDNLWDIEGWITDVKTYPFDNRDRNNIKAGEPLHGMGIRITIDEDMVIKDCVAITDFSPYNICSNITPNFKKIIGLKISAGFNKKVIGILGGIKGCTHLVELLKPIATTAFQTLAGYKLSKTKTPFKKDMLTLSPIINTCYAWAAEGEIVKREFNKKIK